MTKFLTLLLLAVSLLFGFAFFFDYLISSLLVANLVTKKNRIISVESKKYLLKGYFKDNKKVKEFIADLVKKHNFNQNRLNILFSNIEFQFEALVLIAPEYKEELSKYIVPKPRIKNGEFVKIKNINRGVWEKYIKYRITDTHITNGVKFWQSHQKTLSRAEKIYGVPPEYIIAILSIESNYGKNTGQYPTFETLATLAFTQHRRASFFEKELKSFLLMTKSEKMKIRDIKSSYAGALGWGQFMPSNFKIFAVDFDGDGIRDLWNPKDMIGSIANYFKKNGWKKGAVVAVRANYIGKRFKRLKTGYNTRYSLDELKQTYKIIPKYTFNYKKDVSLIKLPKYSYDELWIGAKNFYVITRYNHNVFYAMTVHQLAQKIKN